MTRWWVELEVEETINEHVGTIKLKSPGSSASEKCRSNDRSLLNCYKKTLINSIMGQLEINRDIAAVLWEDVEPTKNNEWRRK